jgi:glycosyltransferase involved in cell wall biosynthesis
MRILMVNSEDLGGGAAKVAMDLVRGLSDRGFAVRLAVGHRAGHDPRVLAVPNESSRSKKARALRSAVQRLEQLNHRVPGTWRLSRVVRWLAEPVREWEASRGVEDFHFPGTGRLLELGVGRSDILHCHNLHGGYFDLRQLPALSAAIPTVLTLHDGWLFSGHCAHSLDCIRWTSGCGSCPYLRVDPPVRRDATAYNWRRKRDILSRCRLYVACPSRWLMGRFEQSILAAGTLEARVIPNGVDLSVFTPGDREATRQELGIAPGAWVLLLAGRGIRRCIWKNYPMLHSAVERIGQRLADHDVRCVILGDDGRTGAIGRVPVISVPYQSDPESVARYYRAADVYLHAARVDTFPNVVLEALACGAAVVATAVGGVPEQVRDGETGLLVNPGDAEAMADRVVRLWQDRAMWQRMTRQGAEDARQRFDLHRQVGQYLGWYRQIVQERSGRAAA